MTPGPSHPSGKVVELSRGERGDAPSREAMRAMPILRGIAQKRIAALAQQLFNGVDDALFDLAERAASNQNQARFFDGMREVRRKRQTAEAILLDMVGRAFSDFEAGKLAPTAEEAMSGGAARRVDTLALVDEAELEETLAINAMVDKTDTRLNRQLYALDQRFTALAGGRKVDNHNNPIGPRQLSQAFGAAVREFEVDLQVKLIVLKLFERHVLAGLDQLYDEANLLLIQAGVLPELRYHVAVTRRTDAAPAPRPMHDATEKAAESAVHEATQALAHDALDGPAPSHTDSEILSLVGELRHLLAARHGGGGAAPAAGGQHGGYASAGGGGRVGGTSVATPTARELLNALSLMQSEIQSMPAAPDMGDERIAAVPTQVKQDLLRQVRRLGGNSAQATHLGSDEDTIDLVGMLFEYALQDRNLPAPIQALLSRLQIPYLKVALMDREFIAQRNHPARKLLDELAHACVGWSEDSDRDRRMYGKVQEIVGTLLKDFDDDTAIFDRLSGEFSEFVDKNKKRSELVERRTAEAARGKERLESAQRTAARAILSRIGGKNVPPAVRDLLTRRWSNYLVLTYLRHGEDSPEWRAATRFVEDLAWSVEPKRDENDKLQLRERTPEIEQLLRHGLAATGLHQSHLDELWREMQQIYDQQTGVAPPMATDLGMPAPPMSTEEFEQQAEALTIRFASSKAGEEIVFSDGDADPVANEMIDSATLQALDTWLKIARALKAGTWFEFIKDDGSRERAKLLWISTIRALYLFVNRNGIKIAEKTANELAEELKDQKAVILEQVALVDRALDAILTRLRETESPGADGEAGASTGGMAEGDGTSASANAAANGDGTSSGDAAKPPSTSAAALTSATTRAVLPQKAVPGIAPTNEKPAAPAQTTPAAAKPAAPAAPRAPLPASPKPAAAAPAPAGTAPRPAAPAGGAKPAAPAAKPMAPATTSTPRPAPAVPPRPAAPAGVKPVAPVPKPAAPAPGGNVRPPAANDGKPPPRKS